MDTEVYQILFQNLPSVSPTTPKLPHSLPNRFLTFLSFPLLLPFIFIPFISFLTASATGLPEHPVILQSWWSQKHLESLDNKRGQNERHWEANCKLEGVGMGRRSHPTPWWMPFAGTKKEWMLNWKASSSNWMPSQRKTSKKCSPFSRPVAHSGIPYAPLPTRNKNVKKPWPKQHQKTMSGSFTVQL